MKILCIDDSASELLRAEEAVQDAGHTFVGICVGGTETLGDHLTAFKEVDAVISDLFFNTVPVGHAAHDGRDDKTPPSGLLVLIECMAIGKPVALCTAMDDENLVNSHHRGRFGWIYDGFHPCTFMPLFPYKDWGMAVKDVVEQKRKQSKKKK